MLPLTLEPFPVTSSCFFQGTTLLPIIIFSQKLLFLSLKELQFRIWQHREEEGEKQAKVGKHIPPLGLTKQGSSQWGYRPTTYKSLCSLCNKGAGKGIFLPCYVFQSQEAMGAIFGHTPDGGRCTGWHETLNFPT